MKPLRHDFGEFMVVASLFFASKKPGLGPGRKSKIPGLSGHVGWFGSGHVGRVGDGKSDLDRMTKDKSV